MNSVSLSLKNYALFKSDDVFNYNIYKMYLLDNQDLSDATLKAYNTYLTQFIQWLKSRDILQPTEDTIKEYKLYLKDSSYTIATKNQYLRAVKHLFKWLDSRDIYKNISSNIKEFRDVKRHKRDSLTINEINKVISDIKGVSEVDLRDKAIIILASVLGLRANEIININYSDIEQRDDYYTISILGKGYKDKSVKKAIPLKVYEVIQDYLKLKTNIKPNDAVFTSTSNRALNQRLTKESLSQIVKNRFRASGINSSRIVLHSLRHLTADATLKATDNNIYKTQHYLRHQNTSTTELYLSEQEDIDINLATDVYNTIFNKSEVNKTREIYNLINGLNASDLDKVFNYIKSIGECNNG